MNMFAYTLRSKTLSSYKLGYSYTQRVLTLLEDARPQDGLILLVNTLSPLYS